jgi:phosphohistidine phosphatase
VAPHTLILLRHAKSDWSGDEADHDRPLAGRGRRQAPGAGRWLDANVGAIDLAVVSTAERARSTWELVAGELEQPPPTRYERRVYAASVDQLLRIVHGLDEALGTVVLVGHNPAMEEFVEALTGEPVAMPTSALAVIELEGHWTGAGRDPGVLRAAGRPPGARR